MSLVDILYSLFFMIIEPFRLVLYELSNDGYEFLSVNSPIDVYLFSDNKLFTFSLNDFFLYFMFGLVTFFVLRAVYKFLKWLFSIPKRIGGLK